MRQPTRMVLPAVSMLYVSPSPLSSEKCGPREAFGHAGKSISPLGVDSRADIFAIQPTTGETPASPMLLGY